MRQIAIITVFTIGFALQCNAIKLLIGSDAQQIIPGNEWLCREFKTKAEYTSGQYPKSEAITRDDTRELYAEDGRFLSYYADNGESALGHGIEKGKYKIDETGIYYSFYEDGRWWDWDESGITIENLSSDTFDLVEESDPDWPLYLKCKLIGPIKE